MPPGLKGLGLAFALGVCLAVANAARAVGQPPVDEFTVAASGPSTVYLPMTARDLAPNYASPFGIVMYGNVDDPAGRLAMRDARSRWVTTQLNWSSVEPNPPDISGTHAYDWNYFDSQVINAQAAGMEVFVLFTGNPGWAAEYPGGPVTNTADLVTFATAMTERYDGDGQGDMPGSLRVNYWSFYAEPDNGDENYAVGGKGYWGHNGAGYAAMLFAVAPAMHMANPNAKVFIGGVAYDNFEPDGPFVRNFITDTLDALTINYGDAAAYIDGVAFHYYPISVQRWPSLREKALEIRSIMTTYVIGSLPLLVPEMGYWSQAVPGAPYLDSDETQQAERLVQSYIRGLSVGIEHMSWFAVFDDGSGTEAHGLFRGTNLDSPKPAYDAYQTLTQQLYGAEYASALAVTGVEGYQFTTPAGDTLTVAWGTTGTPSAQVTLADSCLLRTDLLGSAPVTVLDGDATWDKDGLVNGHIAIGLNQDEPVYISACN